MSAAPGQSLREMRAARAAAQVTRPEFHAANRARLDAMLNAPRAPEQSNVVELLSAERAEPSAGMHVQESGPRGMPADSAAERVTQYAALDRANQQALGMTPIETAREPLTAAVSSTLPALTPRKVAFTVDEGIAFASKRFFFAPHGGGGYVPWRVANGGGATPITVQQMQLELAPYSVTVPTPDGSKTISLAEALMKSKHRPEFDEVGMYPEGPPPPRAYNQYRGPAVKRRAGNASPMIDHAVMLCGGDAALAGYLLDYLAFCVQRPGTRPEVALVLRGGRGTGKGTLFRVMLMIFGKHGLHITQPKHLVGNFNSHLRVALFVFADEAYYAGDKAAEGVLKGLITEPTIAIEMKGHDVFTAPNRIKLVMATNNDWAVPAGADERRFCVIDVAGDKAQDHAYFGALNDWIDNGGAEIFLDHLLSRDLSNFNVRAVPQTAGLDRQKIEGMNALDRFILEALDRGVSLAGREWDESNQHVICGAAASRLEQYRKQSGIRGLGVDTRGIGKRLDEIFGCGPSITCRTGATFAKGWKLPGISDARALAAKAFGLSQYTWGEA